MVVRHERGGRFIIDRPHRGRDRSHPSQQQCGGRAERLVRERGRCQGRVARAKHNVRAGIKHADAHVADPDRRVYLQHRLIRLPGVNIAVAGEVDDVGFAEQANCVGRRARRRGGLWRIILLARTRSRTAQRDPCARLPVAQPGPCLPVQVGDLARLVETPGMARSSGPVSAQTSTRGTRP